MKNESFELFVKSRCPYCEFGNSSRAEFSQPFGITNGSKIVYCDDTEGGCGEPYVVGAAIQVKTAVWKMEPVPDDPT